jgi:hypothetical protein
MYHEKENYRDEICVEILYLARKVINAHTVGGTMNAYCTAAVTNARDAIISIRDELVVAMAHRMLRSASVGTTNLIWRCQWET